MLTAIWAIVIFCILIFIHEFGHFITAKLSGMTVHEFSIGMGPKIWGFKRKETMYNLRILPLGGFVRLEGEDGESDDPNAFCKKTAVKRFLVLVAGATMNIILGFIIFVIIFSSIGSVNSNKISEVISDSAFEEAGIRPGDVITYMEGDSFSSAIHSYRDISFFVARNGSDNSAKITFERDGKTFSKVIEPKWNQEEKRAYFGFKPALQETDVITVIKYSFWECVFVIKSVFLSLWWLITGAIPASSMSGPVAIVGEIGAAAKIGWQSVLNLAGFISVNLGVMNLLPIPALDGGRILFLLIEKIRGKKMKPETEGNINFVFFTLLILLMAVVTFSDIHKLF